MLSMAGRFVCAADEIWRLQRGSDADCLLFQAVATGGERITDPGSRQGTWVIAPGGTVLARTNSRNPEKVLAALEKGLSAWDELAAADRHLPPDIDLSPAHRWEHNAPEDGLVLERIARVVPDEGLDGPRSDRWNRDFVWFTREELADAFGHGLAAGDSVELPLLADRLARLHLVDNARGQTIPYAREELELARLTASVVSREGSQLELAFDGHMVAAADGTWRLGENLWTPNQELPHGLETRLSGSARWDEATRRLEQVELVGVGRHWGRTQNNGRGKDPAPGLVGFLFRPADEALAVAPTFILLYDADWVELPDVPTWRASPEEVGIDVARG